jgi:hypothetical protein
LARTGGQARRDRSSPPRLHRARDRHRRYPQLCRQPEADRRPGPDNLVIHNLDRSGDHVERPVHDLRPEHHPWPGNDDHRPPVDPDDRAQRGHDDGTEAADDDSGADDDADDDSDADDYLAASAVVDVDVVGTEVVVDNSVVAGKGGVVTGTVVEIF